MSFSEALSISSNVRAVKLFNRGIRYTRGNGSTYPVVRLSASLIFVEAITDIINIE